MSESKDLRAEWKKVVGDLSSDQEEAGSVTLLQRITSMFTKSKQQIIREQLSLRNTVRVWDKHYLLAKSNCENIYTCIRSAANR